MLSTILSKPSEIKASGCSPSGRVIRPKWSSESSSILRAAIREASASSCFESSDSRGENSLKIEAGHLAAFNYC